MLPDVRIKPVLQFMTYGKTPKYLDTQKIAVIIIKFEQLSFTKICPKIVDGMANSVDPDQSDLGLHCLDLPVWTFVIITVIRATFSKAKELVIAWKNSISCCKFTIISKNFIFANIREFDRTRIYGCSLVTILIFQLPVFILLNNS